MPMERNNKVSLCVFGLDETNNIVPLYVSKTLHSEVVSLFYEKGKGEGGHYSLINNMSQVVGSQISKPMERKFICDHCINAFGVQEILEKQEEYCSKHNAVNIIFPTSGVKDILRFKNIQNQIECPPKFMLILKVCLSL